MRNKFENGSRQNTSIQVRTYVCNTMYIHHHCYCRCAQNFQADRTWDWILSLILDWKHSQIIGVRHQSTTRCSKIRETCELCLCRSNACKTQNQSNCAHHHHHHHRVFVRFMIPKSFGVRRAASRILIQIQETEKDEKVEREILTELNLLKTTEAVTHVNKKRRWK